MPQGKIKRLTDRGFGFISGTSGELFFHHTEVKGMPFAELREGQQVDYDVGDGKKGPCAVNVRISG